MKTTDSEVHPPVSFEAILRFEAAVLVTLVLFVAAGGSEISVLLALIGPAGYAFPSEAELAALESNCSAGVRLRIYLFAATRFVAVIVGACLCFHFGGTNRMVAPASSPRTF